MCVSKNHIVTIVLIIVCAAVVSACGNADSAEGDVRLSDLNMDSGHLDFQLTDNIYVDANITSSDKYREGVTSYYVKTHEEKNNMKSITADNVWIFEKKPSEIYELIEAYSSGKFKKDKAVFQNLDDDMKTFDVPFKSSENKNMRMLCSWSYCAENKYEQEVDLEFDLSGDSENNNLGSKICKYYPLYEKTELAFADSVELGRNMKALVEDIIGREISESYKCVPVTEENYKKAREHAAATDGEEVIPDFLGEYYQYQFRRDVDGLPWEFLESGIEADEAMKVDNDLLDQLVNGYYNAVLEWPLILQYGKSGLTYLELDCFVETAEPYQEKREVVDVRRLLELIKKTSENEFKLSKMTIYDIELCYAGYFSDPKDGIVKNIIQPFWVIRYCGENSIGSQLVYNAYTGEQMM